jgi:glycosyltransferase involved in cell wall biosynthesis
MVSLRFGEPDGVSVAAAGWMTAFERLGFRVQTVAGSGTADRIVPGLALDAPEPPSLAELEAALGGADLVVVENLCSLPMNPGAALALAGYLRGRRAILHHHDFPWQRGPADGWEGWPPDDPAWLHVTINELSRRELAERGIWAHTIYNAVEEVPPGDRDRARELLEVPPDRWLLLQPTRAIPRKNVPGGIALAEALGAIYWLTGPAEDAYGAELRRLLDNAGCELRRGLPPELGIADAYAAADAVLLPSTWEGFGLPLIEAALQRRPAAVGRFPVADELAAFGFRWFPADDPAPLRAWLEHERHDPLARAALFDHNQAIARRHFSIDALTRNLARLFEEARWPGR